MKVIAVMTPKGGVGKTTTSNALTYILGQEMGARVLLVDVIRHTKYSNVDIIPANGYLTCTATNLSNVNDSGQIFRFKTALEEISEDYDYCICDCGRLLDVVIINILVTTDLLIAPVKPGGFEVSALENLNKQLATIRTYNHNVEVKILLNMARNTLAFKGMETWVKQRSGLGYFSANIKQSTVIEQATLKKLPLPEHAKKADVTASYRKIVEEIVREVG